MLLTYFLNDFETVPVAPIITVITFVFTLHMSCISIVRSLYFRILSASFFNHFIIITLVSSSGGGGGGGGSRRRLYSIL